MGVLWAVGVARGGVVDRLGVRVYVRRWWVLVWMDLCMYKKECVPMGRRVGQL